MKSAALSPAARPAGRGFLPLVPPPITENDMINDDIARKTDEELARLQCPDQDEGRAPEGAVAAYVIVLAAAVFLVLGWVAVDRIWHATVTPANAERAAPPNPTP